MNQKEIYHKLEGSIDWLSGFIPHTNFLYIKKNGKHGVVDEKFNTIIPCEYDDFSLLGEKLKSYLLKINNN